MALIHVFNIAIDQVVIVARDRPSRSSILRIWRRTSVLEATVNVIGVVSRRFRETWCSGELR